MRVLKIKQIYLVKMSKKQFEKGQQVLSLFINSSTTATKPTANLTTKKLYTNESSSLEQNISEQEQPPGDLGTEKPSQPVIEFPKTMSDDHRRSFQKEWYRQFTWIEYSLERDAVLYFACLYILPPGFQNSDPAFTTTGFKNWKTALEQGRGLIKHVECQSHIKAYSAWKEKEMRDSTLTTVSCLVGPTQLENNRYYIKSIAEVIQILVVNELSLRGTFCTEIEKERGLFTNLFEYTMKKDNKLQSIASTIPGNAIYTSPEIQNEIIQIMVEIVQNQISKEIQNSNAYSILADSIRDKQNHEDLAIGARYIDITGKRVERCFS